VPRIVNVGLTYNLLTRHTAFIAVHERVRTSQEGRDVTQPVPLPQGVSDLSVGAEPSLLVLLVMVAFFAARRRRIAA
jgi:Ca-activated chloride channel family protein